MVFVAVAGLTGSMDIFLYGWPLQVLVVGLAFAYVMFATRWLWVSIPTSVLLISAVLLSYYWFTGNWNNWTLWLLTAPVIVGTVVMTIILYVANRKLASQVAYYAGLILVVLTGTAIFSGMMYLVTQPELIRQAPYAGVIDRAIQQGIDQGLREGLKNVPALPTLPSFKDILTPTP